MQRADHHSVLIKTARTANVDWNQQLQQKNTQPQPLILAYATTDHSRELGNCLEQLGILKEKGLLREEEYENKRAAVLLAEL